eukprot:11183617-Lingulodinium_polyedra.AAC.1
MTATAALRSAKTRLGGQSQRLSLCKPKAALRRRRRSNATTGLRGAEEDRRPSTPRTPAWKRAARW